MQSKEERYIIAKRNALDLIAEYAPGEVIVADPMWDELSSDQPQIDLNDRDTFLGIGLEITGAALISTIVIPVIVAALKQLATRSADLIFDALIARFSAGKNHAYPVDTQAYH